METVKKVFPFPLGKSCIIQGGSLTRTFPNCFIWCCSRASKPISREQGTRMDPAYTDFYEIVDGDSFGRHLKQLLNYFICGKACSNSTPADTAKDYFKDLPVGHSMNEIIVHMVHDDMEYVDDKKSLIHKSQLYSYGQSNPFEYRNLFLKTKEHDYQQEHRFVFFLLNKEGNLLLGVRKKPIAIQIDPVTRHLIDQTLAVGHDE